MSNIDLGKRAEDLACDFLVHKGYLILERNYRNYLGEIDIIAIKPMNFLQRLSKKILPSSKIIFVEVKAQSDTRFGLAEERIGKFKQEKLKQLALSFLKAKNLSNSWRIDAVRVDLSKNTPEIKHIESAVESV